MVIKCTLSVSQGIGHDARRFWEAIPLAEYMNKVGPYVLEQGQTNHQIITTYEFDEAKFLEAWEYISDQLEPFRAIPEFTLSACILDKGREVKWYQISLNQGGPSAGVTQGSRSFSASPIGSRG